jgi:hypothetical protein
MASMAAVDTSLFRNRHSAPCPAPLYNCDLANPFPLALIVVCLLCSSCEQPRAAAPSVEFTAVPPFAEGSSEKLDAIEGTATGAGAGERIVLYAKSGVWWLQPDVANPFTDLRFGKWKNRTHPGSDYAALLVKPGYDPPVQTDALPAIGRYVLAIARVAGTPVRPRRKTLMFGGYQWEVRDTPLNPGGTPNDYDPANAWTDDRGFLHMRVRANPAAAPGRPMWKSAEVNLNRSLGYGSYRFVTRDISRLDDSIVFGMFTWDEFGPYREMDIEISRWGNPRAWNGQFVIQPYYLPADTFRFQAPSGRVTFMLRWEEGRAEFRAFRGDVSRWDAPAAGGHVFTSGVPTSGNENIHMNLYVFGNSRQPKLPNAEVVVEKFEYLP